MHKYLIIDSSISKPMIINEVNISSWRVNCYVNINKQVQDKRNINLTNKNYYVTHGGLQA